ncbi:uncharacterized protein Bfra_007543 [Botrytis fragariae]|uniref:Uncharacterized protein n=1 Tax=Botrytis fragariae TaxID=1964551 RepID=A0A8H6AJC6_9HELO|nr:uncharacterized protein Bfra_007543 [Botrytis fragariae]KAF5868345.1 hypothetical protein Bfra_007543 [Botrytis fragariae]
MPTRYPRGSLTKRRERTSSKSASDSDFDSDSYLDDNTSRSPLETHGSWIADFQLTQIIAYNAKLIVPRSVSAIPSLYKDITYNATRKEGDTTRKGANYQNADVDKIYHEYMVYCDLVRRHAEDAMILTNAVIEDLIELISDIKPVRTFHFRIWISHQSYWASLFKQPIRSKLTRKIFIEYLKGLREEYMLPQSNLYPGKSVGLRKVIETGKELLPELQAANDASRALRFTIEFGIYKVLTNRNLTNPDFVPRSEIQRILSFIQRSNDKSEKGHSNDTIGYMTHWLDNEFAAGENVREVEMPKSVHQFQKTLVDISEQVSELIDDCRDERSGIQEFSINDMLHRCDREGTQKSGLSS